MFILQCTLIYLLHYNLHFHTLFLNCISHSKFNWIGLTYTDKSITTRLKHITNNLNCLLQFGLTNVSSRCLQYAINYGNKNTEQTYEWAYILNSYFQHKQMTSLYCQGTMPVCFTYISLLMLYCRGTTQIFSNIYFITIRFYILQCLRNLYVSTSQTFPDSSYSNWV